MYTSMGFVEELRRCARMVLGAVRVVVKFLGCE